MPYRLENEPLENWRSLYRAKFQPVLDALLRTNDPVEAGRIIYDTICNQRWIFDYQVTSDHFGPLHLIDCRLGDCQLLSAYITYALRSVGIPAGIDCLLQNPHLNSRHYWNFLKDASNRTIPFELYQIAPSPESDISNRKKGKVYRMMYSRQPSSIAFRYKKESLPALLRNDRLKDVSDDYFDGMTVAYDTRNLPNTEKLLYLGVFNNQTWIPVTGSEIKRGKAVFRQLEKGIVYQALYYEADRFLPFAFPFVTCDNGQTHFLHPDFQNLQTMELDRKYSYPGWMEYFGKRSLGGQFQSANRSDFSDAVILFTTSDEFDMKYHRIAVNNSEQFKYFRYFSAPKSHCNMAEIQFIGKGEELTGKIIGTEGSLVYKEAYSKYAVFDKDPVTYYDSLLPDSAWVGLELEKPSAVTEIEFLFRNDDNGIREGDIYELFFFTPDSLVSLGKRTGIKNGVLRYENVPSNALYLLHNETRGREERIFTYENDKQVFY